MGAFISQSSTTEEVAAQVSRLGLPYEHYRSTIINIGIDGEFLALVKSDGSLSELLTECKISNLAHATKFKSELAKFCASSIPPVQLKKVRMEC